MSAEAVRYILAQSIKPLSLKLYMERVAFKIENGRGYAWASQKYLSEELGVHARTLRKYQSECERRGYLRVIQTPCKRDLNGWFR